MSTRTARIGFWKNVSRNSQIIFYLGVFLIFSSVGFTSLQMQLIKETPGHVLATVLASAGFAVGYAALAVFRRFWGMPILGLVQFLLFAWLGDLYSHAPTFTFERGLDHQLVWLGVGAILSITLGYALFITFISREGAEFFRASNEIELAAEIHHALVPVIEKRCGHFEMYGASLPSGAVGGDLVDVLEYGSHWTAYVADVSGHGVSSGVQMAMVKASVRSRLLEPSTPADLLQEVHNVFYPLKTPNTFITMGVLQWHSERKLECSLAGHPPILHYSKESRTVSEYNTPNLPLGILPQQEFIGDVVPYSPGDVMLILTDGFSEVFNTKGQEFGADAVKAAFAECAERPLEQIFHHVRAKSLNFGAQTDDQTMLLIRCTE